MTSDLTKALKTHFGFPSFQPGQREVIEHLMAGRSAAAVFPTGGGKSLCYQLPGLLLPGVTLVVSPLIALMKDQIDALSRRGIAAARLDSTLSADEYRDVMQRVRGGNLRLLYVAPERFQNERFREALGKIRVSLFAVDEAHCISEWGHNFRPDYLKLVDFARQCRAERLLALTATATPKVLSDICQAFNIERQCAVRNSCYRPNLTILTTPVEARQHEAKLIARLRERPPGPTIVYVTLQRTAEEIAEMLVREGFHARAYHAGLEDDERAAVQDWFMQGNDGIVVATIAFGMGIDKANIRYVYHFNLPKSLENYAQEIGRAGRDGQPATCEMLACAADLNHLENFAYGDTPTRGSVERLIDEVFAQGAEFDVSYHELSSMSDIRILVVRTLMTYLELDGYLSGGTPFYSTYRFQPIWTSGQILDQFTGERRTFIDGLLRLAKKGKIWFQIDAAAAAQRLGCDRQRVVAALDYLGEQGWLKLEAAGTRNRYRRLRMPPDLKGLAETLHARTTQREQQEIARLEQVLKLAEHDGCQVAALCAHFGEKRSEPCGHCTRCLGTKSSPMARRTPPPLDETVLKRAMAVRRNEPALAEPAIMARWLCGITSPVLMKAKLSKHPMFGALDQQPYGSLRSRLEKEMSRELVGAEAR